MSIAEICTAVIGSLGFLLGLFNLAWMIRNQSPRLHVSPRTARFFVGSWARQGLLGNERFEAVFLELFIEVGNRSLRANTVTSLSCNCGFTLGELPDEPVQTGIRTIQSPYDGEPLATGVYWQRPETTWEQVLPRKLDSGSSELLPAAYRLEDGPVTDGPFRVKVVVCDTFGRTYSTSVLVTKLPSDAGLTLSGGPASSQE